ncbi:DsrE family protein [Nocardioides bruguierae]|uniref:DsrE family protein n=1 Tax=Nocardioides bruguierae TaxID=2945102 RepID=UPI0020226667|nr:hypothetical protein [Nocardioides bruguierae]MCL8025814.1 hypothetical protein [Nocardioides bruguierae]
MTAPAEPGTPTGTDGLPETGAAVVHAWGPDADVLAVARRTVGNVLAALPGARLEVVVQGAAVLPALTDDATLTALVAACADPRVSVVLCANSLAGQGLEVAEVPAPLGVVGSALAHCARRQWAGWAYLRL